MNLIFHDRSASPVTSSGEALLTVERGGNFSLTVAAVNSLKLQPEGPALLAQDADTNTWYLVFGEVAGQQTFALRPRKGKGLQFCSLPKSRTYYEAHGLDQATTRSVRAAIGLEPVRHEKLVLYPLVPRHSTKTPAPVQPVTTAIEAVQPVAQDAPAVAASPAGASEPAADTKPASKYTPEMDARLMDMANSPSDLAREWGMSAAALHTRRAQLKKKAGEAPAPTAPTAPVAPSAPALIYTPATQDGGEPVKKTFGLQARAEELAAYWMEREISRTTPGELAEILNLMRHVPASKRGIEMSLVLDRAEAEQTHRTTAAGKGGKRG